MDCTETEARRRSRIRLFLAGTFPPRIDVPPLAAGKEAEVLHARSGASINFRQAPSESSRRLRTSETSHDNETDDGEENSCVPAGGYSAHVSACIFPPSS